MGLFDQNPEGDMQKPLPERIRPQSLGEFVGQYDLVGPGGSIRSMIESDELISMVFWGPPGTGKTTLARIIAKTTNATFLPYSAVTSGIKEIKGVMKRSSSLFSVHGKRTILFVDEFHRFNRAQQDAFLPMVEDGSIILLGATTENPSFSINGPLLSRCRVFVFQPLSPDEISTIIERTLEDEDRGLGKASLQLTRKAMDSLIALSDGDARRALNILELVARRQKGDQSPKAIDCTHIEKAAQSKVLFYDKSGEEHYNLISAMHKCIRNSDPDAALYWLARMLKAGEDPLYIARRLVRVASEDVGLADPRALTLCIAAMEAVKRIGMPEADCALAEATVFLAAAPKSNALYRAMGEAYRDIERYPAEPVPLHLRNAPTPLMKETGYGAGYRYAHDEPEGVSPMELLPSRLQSRKYYDPKGSGFEKTVKDWLDRWEQARNRANHENSKK
ncbi:replication-associated recombination protein A [Acidobacteriota bacterium]